VVEVSFETMGLAKRTLEVAGGSFIYLLSSTAVSAYQVMVPAVTCGLIEGDTMTHVHVRDEAHVLEGLKIPVDGGWANSRQLPCHLRNDVLGTEVAVALTDRLEDRAPLWCYPRCQLL
jgi:hypothetical protein